MSPRTAAWTAWAALVALCTMHGVAVADRPHGTAFAVVGLWLAMLVAQCVGRMRSELRRAGRWT